MSTWEERMAQNAAARAAVARAEEITRLATPDGWPGHEGHHWHNRYWGRQCSCGGLSGVCCYVLPDEWADPAVERRWEKKNLCPECGEPGVITLGG